MVFIVKWENSETQDLKILDPPLGGVGRLCLAGLASSYLIITKRVNLEIQVITNKNVA